MAAPKTARTDADVETFLASVEDERARAEGHRFHELMVAETGDPGAMWGSSIVGYGACAMPTGTWMRIGFSPRRGKTSVYVMTRPDGFDALLERLGRHSMGKACLYVPRLDDVDEDVLREIIRGGWSASIARYEDAE